MLQTSSRSPGEASTAVPLCGAALRWLWLIACLLGALWAASGAAFSQPPPERERDFRKPIVVAVSEVFFPYSFRDTDGTLKGFAIELTDAVARAVQLNLERVPVKNRDMAEVFRRGGVDMVQFWSETEERRAWAEFSVPIIRFETICLVPRNDARIQKLSDLKGKRVAVGQPGTVGWNYLVTEQPAAIPVYTDTAEQYLRLLEAGEIDAAVMARLTAVSMIDRFGLKNLKVLDDRIPGNAYDVRYCYAVRKGDAQLLARLNEALAILHRTGEFDEIYRKWFSRYEARTFRPVEVVSYVAAALAFGCILATWGFLRQRTLSRRVARQAAELAQQRSLLAALHENHPMATVILEFPKERPPMVVSANSEALRLFATGALGAFPRPLSEFASDPGVRAYLDDAVSRWRASEQAQQWEARIAARQQVLETAIVPLGCGEAGAHRLCVLSNDVTKRRLMDREIAQSRRLRALGELVGGIAHEFNNLLTPIIVTTSQTRLQSGLPPAIRSQFGVIDNAARRAADLTRRLLTFGRKSEERAQPVHIGSAVENCFGLLRPTVDRRVEWSCDIPADLGPIMFNQTDLNQLVFNLVINARDTLLDRLRCEKDPAWSPRLHVALQELPPTASAVGGERFGRVPAAWQKLTVEDNGLGIAPEIVERIFEPFFTTKEVGQGTGLGLATVWHLVSEAGGDVTVESKLGVGTKFHVLLPRWAEHTRPAPTAEAAAAKLDNAAPDRPGSRVLLIEDEPLVAQAAIAVLRHVGHAVTHHLDGEAAWEELGAKPNDYDLLLADVNMPRLSGIDLVRRVREAGIETRIVMMSGRISGPERRDLQALRVDHIIHKPFTASELLEAVHAVLRDRAATGVRL